MIVVFIHSPLMEVTVIVVCWPAGRLLTLYNGNGGWPAGYVGVHISMALQ